MIPRILTFVVLAGLALAAPSWVGRPGDEVSPADARYVGATSCKPCHAEEHATWSDSTHRRTWDRLPEPFRDPARVDEAGRACVGCHATGHGEPERGGFTSAVSTPRMVGVQCEACHGPGSRHVDAAMALVRQKRSAFDEGEDAAVTRTPTTCVRCHKPHVPHMRMP